MVFSYEVGDLSRNNRNDGRHKTYLVDPHRVSLPDQSSVSCLEFLQKFLQSQMRRSAVEEAVSPAFAMSNGKKTIEPGYRGETYEAICKRFLSEKQNVVSTRGLVPDKLYVPL